MKVGDTVRFVTETPRYQAAYDDCDMIILIDETHDPIEPAFRVEYVNSIAWGDLRQWVHPEDIAHV